MFNQENEEFKDYQEFQKNKQESESKSGAFLGAVLLGLFFLPTLIVSGLVYLILFKICKWRPSFNTTLLLILSSLFSLIAYLSFPLWGQNLINLYIVVCVILGLIVGNGFILSRAWQLKQYPELKVTKGWAYNFKYKPSPWDIYKRKHIIHQCRTGGFDSVEAASLGILDAPVELSNGKQYEAVEPVLSYYEEANKSRLITGATGSGKTITMLNLIRNDILAGYPVCFIDFKKAPDIAYHLSRMAKENGRRFYHFKSGSVGSYKNPFCMEQASYDPLETGDYQAKADTVLNIREWDGASEVYKTRTQNILQAVFYILTKVDKAELPNMPWGQGYFVLLLEALKVENLHSMILWLKKDLQYREEINHEIISHAEKQRLNAIEDFYRDLSTNTRSALREQVDGLSIICRTFIMSGYSDWLLKGQTPNHINLEQIAKDDSGHPPIVLFQFSENEEPEFAKYMGTMVVNDLTRVSQIKNNSAQKSLPFGVYMDEFQTLDVRKVAGLTEKGRSANFNTTLSLQTTNQIVSRTSNNAEATLNALMDTINTFIVHNGMTETSAQFLSQIIGKTTKVKARTSGKRNSGLISSNWGNSRESVVSTGEEEVYKLPPYSFQELSAPSKSNGYRAQAYYITKATSQPSIQKILKKEDAELVIARKVLLIPNDSILDPVPDEFARNISNTIPYRKNIQRRPIVQKPEGENIDININQMNNNLLDITKNEYSNEIQNNDISNNTLNQFNHSKVNMKVDLQKQPIAGQSKQLYSQIETSNKPINLSSHTSKPKKLENSNKKKTTFDKLSSSKGVTKKKNGQLPQID